MNLKCVVNAFFINQLKKMESLRDDPEITKKVYFGFIFRLKIS